MKARRYFGPMLGLCALACGSGSGGAPSTVDASADAVPATGGSSWGGSGGSAGSVIDPPEDAGLETGALPGVPASIVALYGSGSALLENWPGGTMAVRVLDATGAPVPDVTVTWSVVSGEGANISSPGTPSDQTDASGVARRTLRGVGFQPSEPFAETLLRATCSAGSVDFVAVTVHQSNIGPVGPLLVLAEPKTFDLGDVKAGSTLVGAAKLQAVVQAGMWSGTPLPNVALRFVNPALQDAQPVANCAGGLALSDKKGIASCDLVIGTALGPASIAAFAGESLTFSSIQLNVVP